MKTARRRDYSRQAQRGGTLLPAPASSRVKRFRSADCSRVNPPRIERSFSEDTSYYTSQGTASADGTYCKFCRGHFSVRVLGLFVSGIIFVIITSGTTTATLTPAEGSPPQHIDKRFKPRTVDQCFGQQIPIQCDPGHMVQVTKVFYRQSRRCRGSFHSNFCTREEASNPACVGNDTCVFTTPYIYLSPECGYSNNFLVTFKCIPADLPRNVCEEGTLSASSGYVISPSYPSKYPPKQNCKVTIDTPPGTVVQVYLIDLYLAYYNYDVTKQCVDTLWIVGKGDENRTKHLCSGKQRGLIFTSESNQVTIYFTSKGHRFLNAKGFWIFFQAVAEPSTVSSVTPPTLVQSIKKAVTSYAVYHNTDTVHSLRPTEYTPKTPAKMLTDAPKTTMGKESKLKVTKQPKPKVAIGGEKGPEQHKHKEEKLEPLEAKGIKKGKATSKSKNNSKTRTTRKMTTESIPITTLHTTTSAATTVPSTTKSPTTYIMDYTEEVHPISSTTSTPPWMEISTAIPVVVTNKPPIAKHSQTDEPGMVDNTKVVEGVGTNPEESLATTAIKTTTNPTPTAKVTKMVVKTTTSIKKASVRINKGTAKVSTPASTESTSLTTDNTSTIAPKVTNPARNPTNAASNNTTFVEHGSETPANGSVSVIEATVVSGTARLAVPNGSSKDRLKVPLWAKEQPSHSPVFFRKISDTTRKSIVGGAGGFLVLMLVVTVLIILIRRHRNNKNAQPPMPPLGAKPENYDDIILAYGSNDTTKGFVNVGFENESMQDYPLDTSSQSGSNYSTWGGTLGSARGLNPIDEGPEIVYMDAKTALGGLNNACENINSGKKNKKGQNKVRWVKSKSLDDIRHTIRYTQKNMTRASLSRPPQANRHHEETTNDKEPLSVSLGWIDGDDSDMHGSSSGDFTDLYGGSNRSFGADSPGGRLQAHLAAGGKQYHTIANLNTASESLAQSETTLYSNPSTTCDSTSLSFMSTTTTEGRQADVSPPYETVHFQHQDEVAL